MYHRQLIVSASAHIGYLSIQFVQQLRIESLMASAKYFVLPDERPAREMRPSLVMYTCHLLVMFSTCSGVIPAQMTTQASNVQWIIGYGQRRDDTI